MVGWYHVENSNKKLLTTAGSYQTKTQLVVTMWDIVRARENTFQGMLIVSDVFDIDELQMEHINLGSKYLQARHTLGEMVMDEQELMLLKKLDAATATGGEIQKKIRQLSLDGELSEARFISRDKFYIDARNIIILNFEQLFVFYENKTQLALNEANTTVLDDVEFILILTAAILFISSISGFYVVRKIASSEGKLNKEIEQRIQTQLKLEQHKERLESDIKNAVEIFKDAEQEQFKSQQHAVAMGHILETSLNEIYMFDVDSMKFVRVNEGARKNLGYSMDELINMTPLDIEPESHRENVKEHLDKIKKGLKKKVTFKSIHKRKDGSTYPIEAHVQLSNLGETPVYVAMVLDISESRKWEDKINQEKLEVERVSHELAFQKIAIEEHAIVCVLDENQNILSVNKKYTDISKYTEKEVIGKNFCTDIESIIDSNEVKNISSTIKSGDIWRGVLHFFGKSKESYWATTTITPFYNKNAEIYQYVVVSTDITDQKISEKKLQRSHKEIHDAHREINFQKLALDEFAIVSSTDVNGCITYANEKFCEVSQYSQDEVIGENHRFLKSDVHSEAFYAEMWKTISLGKIWKGELCNRKKDGVFYWLATIIVPFINNNGQPYKYISIKMDITDQKKIEQQLVARNKEIEKAHEELEKSHHMILHSEKLASVGQLAAGIAHEINTPIQFVGDNTRFIQESFSDLIDVVKAFESLIKAANDGVDIKDATDKAITLSEDVEIDYLVEEVPNAIIQSLEGVSRISKIVRSMKDFSHPGTDNLENIDLSKAIESTINVSRNEWKYVADMHTNFDTSLTSVPCYPGELNQVFLNIIVNAAHAIEQCKKDSDGMGEISISTQNLGESVEIRIADSGGGIPADVRKHIFEPFYTTKAVGKGTGQGLAIAYSVIVDKHNGSIEVESELGVGTTFVINLPLDNVNDEETVSYKEDVISQSGVHL
ncbi:MAG: PAS domain S-box protein [Pseudomonadota bacterium]